MVVAWKNNCGNIKHNTYINNLSVIIIVVVVVIVNVVTARVGRQSWLCVAHILFGENIVNVIS